MNSYCWNYCFPLQPAPNSKSWILTPFCSQNFLGRAIGFWCSYSAFDVAFLALFTDVFELTSHFQFVILTQLHVWFHRVHLFVLGNLEAPAVIGQSFHGQRLDSPNRPWCWAESSWLDSESRLCIVWQIAECSNSPGSSYDEDQELPSGQFCCSG